MSEALLVYLYSSYDVYTPDKMEDLVQWPLAYVMPERSACMLVKCYISQVLNYECASYLTAD